MKRANEATRSQTPKRSKKEGSASTVDKSKWPEELKQLDTIHFRLNSYYTFLSSRKHVIPTFELLKEAPEKIIQRPLEVVDLARIAALVPDDVVFDYFDENQFVLEEKHFTWKDGFEQKDSDMFELKDEYGRERQFKQLLVFEFIDGDLSKSKTATAYKTQIKLPQYTADSMRKLIVRRNDKFAAAIEKLMGDCAKKGVDPWDHLNLLADSKMPQKIEFVDPMAEMEKNAQKKKEQGVRTGTMKQIIRKLEEANFYKDQIVEGGQFFLPPRSAVYGDLDYELSPNLIEALEGVKGITKFYSHQAEAINMIHEGKNVIVSTSTSSGKSLIYQVPVLDSIERDHTVTAMYIFPTKALAQDQKRSLQDLLKQIAGGLERIMVETYDGDTEKKHREPIRANASIIFTNPDMLHANILPNHKYWQRFLRNLRFVVIDELHMYKALFGSHVSLIMRRLRRVCSLLGNNSLQFISCSATLKDPMLHMHNIFGIPKEDIYHVSQDGSPSGGKHVVAWNPPMIDPSDPVSGRKSFISESAQVTIQLIKNNVRTIVFCVVRQTVELVMKEIRHILKNEGNLELLGQVMSYRGGYSAADRRKIEQQMFHGNLKAIISTNALELGIDIGSLDAVVMCGFPISIANFHQQSGRAGRRNKDSLTLLVSSNDPVSQHYMKHPTELIKTEYPDLALDFENILVLDGHLQCAAFEMPLNHNLEVEQPYFGDWQKLQEVADRRLIVDNDGMYHCSPKYLPWPPAKVSIRAIEEDSFAVVDVTNGRDVIIEEVEASRTTFTLYDGAIFIHQGLPYLIREFNPEERYARAERVNVDWTTSQRDYTDVDPVEIEKIRSLNSSDVPIYFGKVMSTMKVFGYFKMDRNNQILDAVEVHNPPVKYKSKGLWIDIPKQALDYIHSKSLSAPAGIHAAQHAIINMLPLFILSGLDEIRTECKAPEKEFAHRENSRKRPARLIVFDSKGGQFGSGLSTKAFDNIDTILEQALDTLLECPCEWGCPECCAAPNCKENSLVLSKYAAIIILAVILGKKIDLDSFPNGPEPNMPEITIETTRPANEFGMVKFSDDVEIIDVRKSDHKLGPPPPKEEEVVFLGVAERRARKYRREHPVKEEVDADEGALLEDDKDADDSFSEDDDEIVRNL